MSWCSDAPEDEAISLFAGLLANPDMTLSQQCHKTSAMCDSFDEITKTSATCDVFDGSFFTPQSFFFVNQVIDYRDDTLYSVFVSFYSAENQHTFQKDFG